MVTILKNAGLIMACTFLLLGCVEDKPEPVTFGFSKARHFPEPTYEFENNPITREGFELGRKLFYDPILSVDNTIECASCHLQGLAFADSPIHPVSFGVDGRKGKRNGLPIQNVAFYETFFWDGGVTHLDFVAPNAIELEFEMDEELGNVVKKLNNNAEYLSLFNKAFDIDSITSPFLLHSLSQFMNMMVSDQSKYDDYKRGQVNLSADELAGKKLFEANCAGCHSGELFTDQDYHNNGISANFNSDKGRGEISEDPLDYGKFRTPSLRNVARTSPYMHNAKFTTLEEVLEHYNSGVIDTETLDPRLKSGGALGIPLTTDEQTKIIAFLKTLTDDEFLSNPLFSNPK